MINSSEHHSDRARFGPFEVDLQTHELWKFGTRLKLVGQPFEILAMLLSRSGQLVTRDELRNRLWPSDTFVDFNHGLNAAVNKLREALSDSADDPRYVETLPRRGYRFRADVEWLPSGSSTLPAAPHEPITVPASPPIVVPEGVGQPAPAAFGPQLLRESNRLQPLLVAGLVCAVLVSGFVLLHLFKRPEAKPVGRVLVERTAPLIPVANTSGPAFSPDGNYVTFFRGRSSIADSGIYVMTVGSDQLLQLTNNDDDCCPVWSADGRWIAFTRQHNHEYSIYLVAADGGREEKHRAERAQPFVPAAFKTSSSATAERKLDTGGVPVRRGEIGWSPDGKLIAFTGPSGLYLLSVDDSAVRRVTASPPAAEDWGPSFSPDGDSVLFVRNAALGVPDEIWLVPVNGADARRVLVERGRIASPPQWSIDGRSVIFSSNRTGHPALWRASLDAPDAAIQISEAGSPAWDPAISRRGYRLAYERITRSLSIWQMDLADPRGKRPYVLVSSTTDTDQGPGPQFSPDGKKLAYMSDRTGTMEIWISNRDGSNAFQLSAVGGAGTPRWSPDSQSVVFDSDTQTGSKIVAMNVNGGAPQNLTPDSFHSVCPSWSRDGKWVYFASVRSGDWQVWKVPSVGGAPVQVTQHGGHAPLESLDGKFIYYAKSPNPEPEIWRIPVAGGDEVPLSLVHPGTWASWQVVDGGILFVGPSLGHQAVLSQYDFAKGHTTTLTVLDRIPFWLGATSDGRTVAFDQPGQEQDQAMLVENFR